MDFPLCTCGQPTCFWGWVSFFSFAICDAACSRQHHVLAAGWWRVTRAAVLLSGGTVDKAVDEAQPTPLGRLAAEMIAH